MSELLDCPFCGKHNLWTYTCTYAPEGLRFVKCAEDPKEDDGCVSGVAVETWNSRPIEDQLRAENERLKMALREIIDTSSKYKLENDDNSNNYWEWDDNALALLIEIDKIVEQALNEVTK